MRSAAEDFDLAAHTYDLPDGSVCKVEPIGYSVSLISRFVDGVCV